LAAALATAAAGSGSMSSSTASAASFAWTYVSAMTQATGSPPKRTLSWASDAGSASHLRPVALLGKSSLHFWPVRRQVGCRKASTSIPSPFRLKRPRRRARAGFYYRQGLSGLVQSSV
jgi:hypothetical protein